MSSLCDLIYPYECLECQRQLDGFSIKGICINCFRKIKCRKQHLVLSDNKLKFNCYSPYIYYHPLSSILKKTKYNKNFYFISFLKKLINKRFRQIKIDKIDIITFVPAAYTKFIKRGFNPSKILAEYTAKKNNIPCISLLKRTASSKSQVHLSGQQRIKNVKDDFLFNSRKSIINKHILIIDDVITTGTTLKSCAKVLKENKALKVSALALMSTENIGTAHPKRSICF